MLELGSPPHVVQATARHADLDVTMRIYAHTNVDTMREALDKIDWDAKWGGVSTRLLHSGVAVTSR
jgi:integrase